MELCLFLWLLLQHNVLQIFQVNIKKVYKIHIVTTISYFRLYYLSVKFKLNVTISLPGVQLLISPVKEKRSQYFILHFLTTF